ncbi:MAG: phosphate acyltransferase, partial [Lentisphaeria bacterium]|nr:phosphate acyltransferase [Lentisphaeria bacterium]
MKRQIVMAESENLMKIAVDAMGGDYAPGIVVEGVTQALYDYPDCEFTLVGHTGKLGFYLQKYGIADHPRLKLHHAETAVEMSDPSAISLRGKKNSSITECARIMKAVYVVALVSPGHTGALVAATKVLNRTLPGIDRPALV